MAFWPWPNLVLACLAARIMLGAAEEEVHSAADVDAGVMLLASVTAVMFTFLMVHSQNDFVKKQTWKVISYTISIFAAVMSFQAFNGMFREYVLNEFHNASWKLPMVMLWCLFWFALLQFFLAVATGAYSLHPTAARIFRLHHLSKLTNKEVRRANKPFVECWALIFGHVTGFAAIAAFGYLQEILFHYLGHVACIAALLAVLALIGIFNVTHQIRKRVILQDQKEDLREAEWDSKTEEVENDALALTASFLMTNAFRQWITGLLPNAEGEEQLTGAGGLHTVLRPYMIFYLLLCAVAMACLAIFWEIQKENVAKCLESLCRCSMSQSFDQEHENRRRVERLKDIFASFAAMSVAWCWFFSAQWFLELLIESWVRSTIGTIVLALFCTLCAYGALLVGGRLQDYMAKVGDRVKWHRLVLSVLVKAMGMCIGFAWEKGFDASIDATASRLATERFEPLVKFMLSILICLIVIPAWRLHILPKIVEQEEEEEEMEDEKEEPLLSAESAEADRLHKEMGETIKKMEAAFKKRLKELRELKDDAGFIPGKEQESLSKIQTFADKVIKASQEKIPMTVTIFEEHHGLKGSFV